MILYPAMDLIGGRVVRLAQGRFDEATFYPDDPGEALARFGAAGAQWAHVVDLDGARARTPVQHGSIAALAAAAAPLRLQVAGGFRTRDQVARMLDAGAGRVVIGSLAVERPELVAAIIAEFGGDRITLSLDVRIVGGVPRVCTAGWTEDSGLALWDVAARFPAARHLLVTDIGRDGMLSGPNLDLISEAKQAAPHLAFQSSGGVRDIGDIREVSAAGAAGAIVGKALWEKRIELVEALRAGG